MHRNLRGVFGAITLSLATPVVAETVDQPLVGMERLDKKTFTGELARTPSGTCVGDAFVAARFPAFDGRGQTYLQRFVLGSPMPDGLPRPLGHGSIVTVMKGQVSSKVGACYNRYGKRGKVRMKLVVAPTGVVTSAEDVGDFRGSETASCIAEAVLAAHFPTFEGSPQTVVYPFVLR